MKIKYEKIGCRCTTNCPNLPPKQYKYKEVRTAVGSIECSLCKHFVDDDEGNQVVDCGFIKDGEK